MSTQAPTTRVSFTRGGVAQCAVVFPCEVTPAMYGHALTLGHEAIVTALMREDGAHPRERADYMSGVNVSMTDPEGYPAIVGTRVMVRAV